MYRSCLFAALNIYMALAGVAKAENYRYLGIGKGATFMSWFIDESFYQFDDISEHDLSKMTRRRTFGGRSNPKITVREDEIWRYTVDPLRPMSESAVSFQFYSEYRYPNGSEGTLHDVYGIGVRYQKTGNPVTSGGLPVGFLGSTGYHNVSIIIAIKELEDPEIYFEMLGAGGAVIRRFDVNVPNCAACRTGACAAQAGIGSVDYEIPIGLNEPADGSTGQPVSLRLYQKEIALTGREAIQLVAPVLDPSVAPQYDTGNKLQSVRVGAKLATIEDTGGGGEPVGIKVSISSDHENPGTSVERVVTFTNKTDEAMAAYLECDDHNRGRHVVSAYRKSPAGDWTLETGNGLRRETRSVTEVGTPPVRTSRLRIEERVAPATEVLPAVYSVVSDTVTVSELVNGTYQEIENVVDPDVVALSTTTSYYGDGEDSSPDSSGSAEGMGKIKQVVHSTGEIENHYYYRYPETEFFDFVHVVKRSFGGVQLAKEIITESVSGASPVTGLEVSVSRVTERADGQVVSKTETLRESRINNGYLLEVRVYSGDETYTSTYTLRGAAGEITKVYPDGRATIDQTTVDAVTGYINRTMQTGHLVEGSMATEPEIDILEITEVITDNNGEEISNLTKRYKDAQEVVVSWKIATVFDSNKRAIRFEHYVDGRDQPVFITEREYACCGLSRDRDQGGTDTFYKYDDLGRTIATNRAGISSETVFLARTVSQYRYGQDVAVSGILGGLASPDSEISRKVRNVAGDVVEEWVRSPQDGTMIKTEIITEHGVGGGIGLRVKTLPPVTPDDGGEIPQQLISYFIDGQVAAVEGNLDVNRGYRYSATSLGSTIEKYVLDGGVERENLTESYDWAGNRVNLTYNSDLDGVGGDDRADASYNSRGQLSRDRDPDGLSMLYVYSSQGVRTLSAIDLNDNGIVDFGTDRIVQSETDLAARQDGEWVLRTTQKQWRQDASETGDVESYTDVSLDGLRRWTILNPAIQNGRNSLVRTIEGAGAATEVLTRPDQTVETKRFMHDRIVSVSEHDSEGKLLFTKAYSYDALGRLVSQNDSRTGISSRSYLNDSTDVAVGFTDDGGHEQILGFDHRGRQVSLKRPSTMDAGGATVANLSSTKYYPDGGVKEQSGDGRYRTTWSYDYAGRVSTVTTYGSTESVTRWVYDSSRGFLIKKLYNSPDPESGTGPVYTYTPAGRPKTRTQARLVSGNPLVTTHTYGTAAGSSIGDLDEVVHSDGTPGYSITARDRLGKVTSVLDGSAGTRTFTYALQGEISAETVAPGSGILGGQSLSWDYDDILRPRKYSASFGEQSLGTTGFRFGPAGEIAQVSGNGNIAEYRYHGSKQVLERITYRREGETKGWLESGRGYDSANRLTRVTVIGKVGEGVSPLDNHSYGYDELGRVSAHTGLEGDSWNYRYNGAGEVEVATKLLRDGVTAADGGNFKYLMDGIGNRLTVEQSRKSGDPGRLFSYTPDSLNQLATKTHPDFFDVLGTADTSASVTVNGQSADRQGRNFRKEIGVDNSVGPKWVDAEVTDGTLVTDGHRAVPEATVDFAYDDDGNMTFDGLWNFSWDAENRLTKCERSAALVSAGAPYLRVEHDYDMKGRRIRSSIFTSVGAGPPSEQTIFVFDGWKCLGEIAMDGQIVRKFTWGLDLAGDVSGESTGNVGALLWLVDQASDNTHIYLYDRNGNVTGLVDQSTQIRSATYDYDASGQMLVCAGSYSKLNPFTFSTKYADHRCELLYYGYRWLSPSIGRWISRDPGEEGGGLNLYSFNANDSVNQIDTLGLKPYYVARTMDHLGWTVASGLMNRWMDKPASSAPKSDDETSMVTMKWLLGFARAKKIYDELYTAGGYKNESAKGRLRQHLTAAGTWAKGGKFGDLSKSTKDVQATLTDVNTRAVNEIELDDLGGALGTFQMNVNVEGRLVISSAGKHDFCYDKVGLYVVDSYDFNDDKWYSQPLGFWNFNDKKVSKDIVGGTLGKDWTYVNNKTFRKWRDVTKFGGDFTVYTDLDLHSVSDVIPLD